jgi:hypothetical protein
MLKHFLCYKCTEAEWPGIREKPQISQPGISSKRDKWYLSQPLLNSLLTDNQQRCESISVKNQLQISEENLSCNIEILYKWRAPYFVLQRK